MITSLRWKILAIACVAGFCIHYVKAQSDFVSAREHFERARSYSSADDPRAEEEYRQAIADRAGVYPEAWEWLSRCLAHKLRLPEAVTAWRTYIKQAGRKVLPTAQAQLHSLERGAELKSRSDSGEFLSAEESVELVRLVDGFADSRDAVPYAEKAVKLHPESAKALLALANLIKTEQKDRALELFNRAVVFEPNDPSVYNARGGYYFWVRLDPIKAELDYRRAIELSNGLIAAPWAGLGDSLALLGRRDEALAAYRKYLSIRPKSAAHYDGEIKKSIEMLQSKSPQR